MDLGAVERTLRTRGAPGSGPEERAERTLGYLVEAYALLDASVGRGTDLLVPGHSGELLALNHTALYGRAGATGPVHRRALEASERRFYGLRGGGVEALVEWRAVHARLDPWQRGAGLLVQTLAMPQVFVEGNHRTGALLASHELLHAGLPPFVLSAGCAAEVRASAAEARTLRRGGIAMLLAGRRLRRRLAEVLRGHSNSAHLRDPGGDPRRARPATIAPVEAPVR